MGLSFAKSKLVIIGGSAGSMKPLLVLLETLPEKFRAAIVLVVHRQRNVPSKLDELFSQHAQTPIIEPDDKEPVLPGHIYLAPQNYHLLLEKEGTFALEYSEPVCFSRPSIDVTLQSAALTGVAGLLAILLSGANADGTEGIGAVLRAGATALIQLPESAEFPVMPAGALRHNPGVQSLRITDISLYLNQFVNS